MTDHPIPLDALDGKVGVLGVTGSGKTFTAIGLVERLLDAGRQVIIVDPTGAYYGLRTAFPLPIFGGLAGDLPLAEGDGEAIARVIVERGVSAIVDVSLLLKESHAAPRRFMAGFVATLKKAPIRARYLVMDEADEFMPENVGGGDAKLFGDLKWIVRRGRKDGWRVLMVTQRPQDIAKSVLTQCETLVLHKLTAPQDRRAVEEWVKGNADAEQAKEVLTTLARLDTGEAWIWSPRHDLLVRAKLPANRSADTSRTPDADDAPVALERLAPVDLDALRAALASAPANGEDDRLAGAGEPIGADELAAKDAVIEQLRRDVAQARRIGDLLYSQGIVVGFRRATDAVGELAFAENRHPSAPPVDRDTVAALESAVEGSQAKAGGETGEGAPMPEPAEPVSRPVRGRTRTATSERMDVTAGETAPALNATAVAVAALLKGRQAAITWDDALLLVGRRPGSGDAGKARAALLGQGLMVAADTGLVATSKLRAGTTIPAAARPEPAELVRLWAEKLRGPGGDILLDLAAHGPASRAEIGRRIGKAHTSGWFGKGVKDLTRSNLVRVAGGVFTLHPFLTGA